MMPVVAFLTCVFVGYIIKPKTLIDESILSGHGGGDSGIVHELYDYLSDSYTGYCASNINVSVKNHLIGFAAEKSRHGDTVENIDKYFASYGLSNDYSKV